MVVEGVGGGLGVGVERRKLNGLWNWTRLRVLTGTWRGAVLRDSDLCVDDEAR